VVFDQLNPARWRFTAKADVEAYGDRWWTFDPVALVQLGGRRLIEIEDTIGMPIVVMLEKLDERATIGQFAALWVSMHLAGHTVAWDEFDVAVFTTVWEAVPAETPLDSGEVLEMDASSSPEPATESATS